MGGSWQLTCHTRARGRWRELVPQREDVIDDVAIVGDRLVVTYLQDVKHVLELFTLDGAPAGRVGLPGIGTIAGISGRRRDDDFFFGFTSFLYPTTIFRYHLRTGETEVVWQPALDFDAERTRRRRCSIRPRTARACRCSHPPEGAGARRHQSRAALRLRRVQHRLTPSFSPCPAWRGWRLGGVYAVPNLRGGGEYGEAWHEAGH